MATSKAPRQVSPATAAADAAGNDTGPLAPATKAAGADELSAAANSYPLDPVERWILFLDALRERADNMIESAPACARCGLPAITPSRRGSRQSTSPARGL